MTDSAFPLVDTTIPKGLNSHTHVNSKLYPSFERLCLRENVVPLPSCRLVVFFLLLSFVLPELIGTGRRSNIL